MGDFDHPPRALADASKFFYVLPFSGKTKIIIFPLEEQQYADSRNIKLYICKTIFFLSTSLNGPGGWGRGGHSSVKTYKTNYDLNRCFL